MVQKVFVVGAPGRTGGSIVDALLKSSNFDVIIAIRPSSRDKPIVSDFQQRGATVRLLDLKDATLEETEQALTGIETVVSAIHWQELPLQRLLVDAAKKVGVKRFVPCDFGTPCVRGFRLLHDEKLAIHDYILEAGIGYTFIDVGWWFQLTLPPVVQGDSVLPLQVVNSLRTVYDSKEIRSAVTDLHDIGLFVACIIADPRTINRYVFCWGEELTKQEILAVARQVSGQEIPEIPNTEKEVRDQHEKAKADEDHMSITYFEYQISIWIRGDNTIEKAKKPEYGSALDARELYPDIKVRTLRDFAAEYYATQ